MPMAAPAAAMAAESFTAASVPCDPRAVALPGEAPLGAPCTVPSPLPPAAVAPGVGGEIVVSGSLRSKEDPLEVVNQQTFAAVQAVDDAIIAPVSRGYESAVPKPVRNGLRNFFSNLHEPAVMVNFLLQGKPGKAAETIARFAINSTIGAAGLFDIAKRKPFKLPYRRNGFADTLGYYGVPNGAFLFLPLIGPTTVRDFAGQLLDAAVVPMVLPGAVGRAMKKPAYALTSNVVFALDSRVEHDEALKRIRAAGNPYAALRETYLCNRRAEIDGLHNRPVEECSPPVAE